MNEQQPANPSQQPDPKSPENRAGQIEYTAMLAISIALLQAFITANPLDLYEGLALACFALAIPALAGALYQQLQGQPPMKRITFIGYTGAAFAFFGVGFTFTHISLGVGRLFAGACCFCFIVLFLTRWPRRPRVS